MKKIEVASASVLDVLSQRKWWRTRQDGPVRRRDMDIRHKANTVAWLLTHAEEVVMRSWAVDPAYGVDYAPRVAATEDPIAWMLQRPFTQALLRDLAGEAGVLFEATVVQEESDYLAGWNAGRAAAFSAVRVQGRDAGSPAARALVARAVDLAENA